MTYFRSISFRVTFWVSVIVVAIVAIHLYTMRPERRFFELKMQESERVAGIIKSHLLAEMKAGEPHRLQGHLELFPGQEGIHRVEIVDTNMVVRFSTDTSRVGLRVSRSEEVSCRNCHEKPVVPERLLYDLEGSGRIFAVDHVLFNKPVCTECHAEENPILGNLIVELSLTGSDTATMQARRRLMLVAGGLVIFMLIGMGTIIHLLVGRPVTGLLTKMSRIEAGDFDVGPPARRSNEFQTLETGFHNMVERLRDLYSQMESIIEERTDKLYAAQAQVMHQEKLAGIGQLAAGVAHEIGNPLTAIDSMAQLLAVESKDADVRDKVNTIQRQVDRISEIVHNMADLSRPLSSDVEDVNVNAVIRSVLGLVKYDPRFRNIDVIAELDEAIPFVRTLEDRLFGVFLNLVLNAADAMPQGGSLRISTAVEGNDLWVGFRDNGHGIAEENLEKIFDAYFTTKTRGAGTGLGLTVCRTFLRSLGGDIVVESAVGEGSYFNVRIPVAAAHDSEEAP